MFLDRDAAGERLAFEMRVYGGACNALILGIPRGGVVVGSALARVLDLPLDVFISLKLRAPLDPEVALGAATETGSVYLNPELADLESVPPRYLEGEIARARKEIEWRRRLYRGGRPLPSLKGRVAILVDDGAATGATLLAAAQALRGCAPGFLVAAVPVAPAALAERLRPAVDDLFIVEEPEGFASVGQYYRYFEPVEDGAVRERLSIRRGVAGGRRQV